MGSTPSAKCLRAMVTLRTVLPRLHPSATTARHPNSERRRDWYNHHLKKKKSERGAVTQGARAHTQRCVKCQGNRRNVNVAVWQETVLGRFFLFWHKGVAGDTLASFPTCCAVQKPTRAWRRCTRRRLEHRQRGRRTGIEFPPYLIW